MSLGNIGTAIAIATAVKQAFSKRKTPSLNLNLPDEPSERDEIDAYLRRYHTYAHEQLGINRSKM